MRRFIPLVVIITITLLSSTIVEHPMSDAGNDLHLNQRSSQVDVLQLVGGKALRDIDSVKREKNLIDLC